MRAINSRCGARAENPRAVMLNRMVGLETDPKLSGTAPACQPAP